MTSRRLDGYRFYDMHCHAYELGDDGLEEARNAGILVVGVSDDMKSLEETLSLAQSHDNLLPCAGYHPWNLRENGSLAEAAEIARLAVRLGVDCIGEVGLDTKFVPRETLPLQREILGMFLDVARELDLYVTLHTPGAWRETLEMLLEYRVEKAMFHWYTGPIDLINEITSNGYYISINPAIRIQDKHRRVAHAAPLEYMVLESDAPYNYRGLRLHPLLIADTARVIAEVKGLDVDRVVEVIGENSRKLLIH